MHVDLRGVEGGPARVQHQVDGEAADREARCEGERIAGVANAREQRLALLKAGGRPRACPPEGKQAMDASADSHVRRDSRRPR